MTDKGGAQDAPSIRQTDKCRLQTMMNPFKRLPKPAPFLSDKSQEAGQGRGKERATSAPPPPDETTNRDLLRRHALALRDHALRINPDVTYWGQPLRLMRPSRRIPLRWLESWVEDLSQWLARQRGYPPSLASHMTFLAVTDCHPEAPQKGKTQ